MKITRYIFSIFSILIFLMIIKKFPKYLDQEKFIKIFFLSCLFIFFVIKIFIKKNFQKKINIFFIIFVISTYTLNLLVGFHYYFNSTNYKNEKKYEKLGINFDKRNPIEYIKDSGDKKLLPFVTPNELMQKNAKILVLSGISNQKYLKCNEYGNWKSIYTDNYGYNNSSTSSNFDLLLVGDSFAQGFCVKKANETHNLLNKKDIKTYSIGYAGNGPLLSLASLVEISKFLKFEKVIWLFFRNDFYDIKWEKNNPNLKKYLDKNFQGSNYFQDLKKINIYQKDYIKKNETKKIGFNFQESFFQLKFLNDYLNRILNKYQDKGINDNEYILSKIFNNLDKRFNDKEKMIIYLPNQKCFVNQKKQCDNEILMLKKLTKKTEIKVFDFRDNFVNKDHKIFFALGLDRTHYSILGYKNLSNFIFNIVSK